MVIILLKYQQCLKLSCVAAGSALVRSVVGMRIGETWQALLYKLTTCFYNLYG